MLSKAVKSLFRTSVYIFSTILVVRIKMLQIVYDCETLAIILQQQRAVWQFQRSKTERPLNNHWVLWYTLESRFFEPPRETKIALKYRVVREIEGKVRVFDWTKGNGFLLELSGGSKDGGFEKSVFHFNIKQVPLKTTKRLQWLQKQSHLSGLSCSSAIPVSTNNINFYKNVFL